MTMKKLICIVLALICVFALCACGETENPTTTKPTTGNHDTPRGYLFTYNGTEFGVDMKMDSVLAKLGEPKSKYTSESCAFGGSDTVYYYSSIQISTNDELGYERIYSIYLEDDLVSTQKGISVGSTADAVKAAYGEPINATDNMLVYGKAGMTLRFNLKDGAVSTILYTIQ